MRSAVAAVCAAVVLCVGVIATLAVAAGGAASPFPTESYGYVPISTSAQSAMFYGIRGDPTNSPAVRATLPLVMWLQGGPGASSLFGMMLENGPTKLGLNATNPNAYTTSPREHAWTKYATMLYVDNPVGTGYSYSMTSAGFSTSGKDIGDNLVTFMRRFLVLHPEFVNKDFWVMGESYAGSMISYFGVALLKAKLPIKFRGVSLGDGWVDPVGCMESYSPYMQATGLINAEQGRNITALADAAKKAVATGHYQTATNLWGEQQGLYELYSDSVNVYNIRFYYDYTADNLLQAYVSSPEFLAKIGPGVIPAGVTFNGQANQVFAMMGKAFARDSIAQVQTLIDAGVSVNILGGQLDLIVDNLCIVNWIKKLTWSKLKTFLAAPRNAAVIDPLSLTPTVNAFVQQYANVRFWQVPGAGHMLPLDQPASAEYVFRFIITNGTVGSDKLVAPVRRPVGSRRRPWMP